MIKKTIISLCFAVALLASTLGAGTTPVFAAKPDTGITLQLLNRAVGRVTVEFKGPQSYTFSMDPNVKTEVEMVRGKYDYRYEACGTKITGKISVPPVKNFKTIRCVQVKVTFINQTGHPLQLQLSGPADYRFTFQPGTSKFSVLKGKYESIAVTQFCSGGKMAKGEFQPTNGMVWRWHCGRRPYFKDK